MNNNHASDCQPGTLKTPSEYSGRAFLCTFQTLFEHLLNTQTERVLQRCSESVGEVHLQP